jgi:hypothetical protein
MALLDGLGLKYAQVQWYPAMPPKTPYVIFVPQKTKNRKADNKVNKAMCPYTLELYTLQRDIALEKRIQAALDDAGIFWERDFVTDEDGPVYITIYSLPPLEE